MVDRGSEWQRRSIRSRCCDNSATGHCDSDPGGALGLALTVMTVMEGANPMGREVFPRFMWRGALGTWLITASHHQPHHERYRCNYELTFRFWDRLCGTNRELGNVRRSHAKAAARAGRGGALGRSGGGEPGHAA
ncbi:sterol desaturase family protein [Sphingomonas sp. T1]|uniref:sterol desaturase family protein n=1 Tax=Sphingomonas sp. T1 TaxID=2653172 RepID=UPI003FA687D1